MQTSANATVPTAETTPAAVPATYPIGHLVDAQSPPSALSPITLEPAFGHLHQDKPSFIVLMDERRIGCCNWREFGRQSGYQFIAADRRLARPRKLYRRLTDALIHHAGLPELMAINAVLSHHEAMRLAEGPKSRLRVSMSSTTHPGANQ